MRLFPRLDWTFWARPLLTVAWLCVAARADARQVCDDMTFEGHGYTVCTTDTTRDRVGLFWRDAAGKPFATFDQLAASLARARRTLIFGMNAGMFQTDLSPVGLYIEDGEIRHRANTRDGPGNFHMKPNGVFFFGPDGVGVLETQAYLKARLRPDFATQSGPMLVIDGQIHPKIQPDGTSLKIRNGVGVRDAHTAVFAISHDAVSFHAFASLFRDQLGCANALFLDGTISSLYAPALGHTVQFLPVGPMLGVTERAPRSMSDEEVFPQADGEIVLLVDADACPVKDEVYRVAERHALRVAVVANAPIAVPRVDWIVRVTVGQGLDVADDWIAERARPGAIVITADIPLAARCVKAGASVIAPNGKIHTDSSIGATLATRNLMDSLRSAGEITGGPRPFAPRDRSAFLSALDVAIQRLKRARV